MTTIYLIRHAEAEGNLYRVAHGQYNSTITPRGYRQLGALRRRFADIPIDAVYGSDLFRTQTTASAIYKPKGLVFHAMPLLREVSLGAWEEMTWVEIERMDHQMLVDFNKRPDRWRVDGAEPFAVVRDRMMEAIRQIARECPDATVAATSHGAASRVLLGTLHGLSLREIGETRHGDNTSVSKLEVEGDQIRVIYEGDNSHMPPELSTFRRQSWHKSSLATEPGLWFRILRDDEAGMDLEAMLEEEAVGRVAFTFADDALELEDFRLTPALRGQRYGAQLMGQAVKYARRRGRERVRLLCGADLAGYFHQFGFAETGRRGEDRVMELDLRLIMRDIPN